ncbi:MAG: PspC domain-containing protein [Patescibacteria group bacterium]|nr:PspC domain-containing protein [Patescibacteria group bacterium]
MINSKKLLRRPRNGRVFAGVALGFARYFDVDVVLIRLIWVVLLLPGGLPGILPYLICWLVIPAED